MSDLDTADNTVLWSRRSPFRGSPSPELPFPLDVSPAASPASPEQRKPYDKDKSLILVPRREQYTKIEPLPQKPPSPPRIVSSSSSGWGLFQGLSTNRSSSVPTRCNSSSDCVAEQSKREKPKSLPEDRTLSSIISPKAYFCRLSFPPKQKHLKVVVLGQSGVGKTALVVRFITKRFIGEYDPTLQKIYTYQTVFDGETVCFEILDTAGQPCECLNLESNIRWAEAFILMYSVTDKCSFDECSRLKFLINYNRRRRRLGTSVVKELPSTDFPVLLVGNKTDQIGDRMVTLEEGLRRSKEIGCNCFYEISVRESPDQVQDVFYDTCRFWRFHNRLPKLKRSSSDVRSDQLLLMASPDGKSSPSSPSTTLGSISWSESSEHCALLSEDNNYPFRNRAQTEGQILTRRQQRWKFPPPSNIYLPRYDRRMSISMRGSNASC